MRAIGEYEIQYDKGPLEVDKPAKSSYHPLEPINDVLSESNLVKSDSNKSKPVQTLSSPWLPCHYFDYVAGTSTGG